MSAGLDFSMHSCIAEGQSVSNIHSDTHPKTPLHPGSVVLRRAIRRNIVSFPSQVPVILRQRDAGLQWRAVLLFFVRGWSSPRIAARFHVPTHKIWQILEDWSVRAWALGCIQVIDQEAFAACCRVCVESGVKRHAAEVRPGGFSPAPWLVSQPIPNPVLAAAGLGAS